MEKEISTKANAIATAIDEVQPKSLDYSEHDSLVSTVTTTSTESKRSENVLKPNALERRYHLLYLRVFEIQCMFESLLEKRNSQLLSEEFRQAAADTSDEEPVAKIPKFNLDSNFISHKTAAVVAAEDDNDTPSDENTTNGTKQLEVEFDADGDADFEDSEEEDEEGEMECIALKSSDCVDSVIVPVKKSLSPKLKESPVIEEQENIIVATPRVNRRPKDFSKFNRSNRKSNNCAIFYYKHIDTDNDQLNNDDDGKESEPTTVSSEDDEEEVWEYSNVNNNNDNNNGINETEIAVTLSDDKLADETKLDNCLPKINNDDDSTKCPSSQQYLFSNVSNTSKVRLYF